MGNGLNFLWSQFLSLSLSLQLSLSPSLSYLLFILEIEGWKNFKGKMRTYLYIGTKYKTYIGMSVILVCVFLYPEYWFSIRGLIFIFTFLIVCYSLSKRKDG
jgi:hypothetical protein